MGDPPFATARPSHHVSSEAGHDRPFEGGLPCCDVDWIVSHHSSRFTVTAGGCGSPEETTETADALSTKDAKHQSCDAKFELFDVPGGNNTQVLGINAEGTIVGRFDDTERCDTRLPASR